MADPEIQKLAKLILIDVQSLETLNGRMTAQGKADVLKNVFLENERQVAQAALKLGVKSFDHETRHKLREEILKHEKEMLGYLAGVEGETIFDKAAVLARKIARVEKGFFLKKEFGAEILKKRPPENLLKFMGYGSADELLSKHDVTEIFSALRFMESDDWMHETFDEAYSAFTPEDFEERDISVKVLGPEWKEVAKKFVLKKHHNLSHLKEFGVIFINPIAEDVPGKFIRDFALLFHYFHEIEFYSKLFRRYAALPDFATNLKMLLRGDVKGASEVPEGEWLIVQRYFSKENPGDPRQFIPRVNPESLHWKKAELDLAHFAEAEKLGLAFWGDLDWVGEVLGDEIASLDMEDNAMAAVSLTEGPDEFFNYHQREALWLKIFTEYMGGPDAMEKILMDNFLQGTIRTF